MNQRELPDPLRRADGTRLALPSEWEAHRKTLLAQILRDEYGPLPPLLEPTTATLLATQTVSEGSLLEQEIRLTMGPKADLSLRLLLTTPPGEGPFPAILCGDLCWRRVSPDVVTAAGRRGYALAEFDRTQVAPDSPALEGLYQVFPDYAGGRLAAWAWAFHRVVDYLTTLPTIDAPRIAVTGHSRGGKAALLAGATDTRIALTAPNNSGCGGAGCYRFQAEGSEDIAAILRNFPYWFQPRFAEFIGRVEQLPFDQHTVKALVAPRALLSTEALGDLWANPHGTQVSHLAAREVFAFLGAEQRIGIAFRPGTHEHNAADWEVLLDFADSQLFDKPVARRFDQLAFA